MKRFLTVFLAFSMLLLSITKSNNSIERSHFTSLESAYQAGRKVKVLDLSNNQLSEVEIDFARLPNLRNLILDDNAIDKLPIGIESAVNLKQLSINGCPLLDLDEVANRLVAIEGLESISAQRLVIFFLYSFCQEL